MSDHIATREVRHDVPSVIHQLSQEELLYMRAKGLSWKHIEEAEKAGERRRRAAAFMLFLTCGSLGCFLCVRLYTVGDTTTESDFFVPTDKPGVLNSTHEWPSALPAGQPTREVSAGLGGGGGSRFAFAPEKPVQLGRLRPSAELAARPTNKDGFLGSSTTVAANAPASSDATVAPTEANSGPPGDRDSD
ncbi:uncharacterized protein [Dermacentor andersoni]|uniref:uncharacterized protein isoform X2 n=1 Tax=Dermacentor andersoni TaxID=34620 RepID=UPI0024159D98|nr:uncharacterized protein LOC129387815 isoform X2 [Dermacentor andersoni]